MGSLSPQDPWELKKLVKSHEKLKSAALVSFCPTRGTGKLQPCCWPSDTTLLRSAGITSRADSWLPDSCHCSSFHPVKHQLTLVQNRAQRAIQPILPSVGLLEPSRDFAPPADELVWSWKLRLVCIQLQLNRNATQDLRSLRNTYT